MPGIGGKKRAGVIAALILLGIALLCTAQEFDATRDSVDIPKIDEIEAVELLIAAPSLKSPASIAGHLFLLLRRKNDISGLSAVIGFVANTCLYSLRGLFGRYRSLVQKERLVSVITRNTLAEDRTIHRLQLKLTRPQLERLTDFYQALFDSYLEEFEANPDAGTNKAFLEHGTVLLSFFQAASAFIALNQALEKRSLSLDRFESAPLHRIRDYLKSSEENRELDLNLIYNMLLAEK